MLKETIMKDLIILVGMLVIATSTVSAQVFTGQKYSKDANSPFLKLEQLRSKRTLVRLLMKSLSLKKVEAACVIHLILKAVKLRMK